MTSFKLALLLAPLVLADVGLRRDGSYLGPIRDLDCTKDGGLWCTRDSGTAIGSIACASATSTTPGCVDTLAQTWSGNKTLTGTLKAAVVDAGAGNFGQVDIRGSTITSGSGSATFTLQSNAADSTTSSTVPAMNFSLGADITNSDLGWCFTDSFGNQRLCGTEAGTWMYAAHATATGAATVSGGNFSSVLGNGGVASGATPAGAGGSYVVTTGTGGASNGTTTGGTGGTMSLSTGGGGASSGTQKGGQGGSVALFCGNGGGGQTGGGIALIGGTGGTASASWAAGAGGTMSFAAGVGGVESTGAAANGGSFAIAAGAGGAAVSGTAGTGGDLTLKSGNAGAKNAGTGAFAGAVNLDTGTTSVASDGAALNIGTTNAGTITIGRAAMPHSVLLPGTTVSGGQPTQIAQLLLTGDTGISLSKSSQLSSTSIDFPNILAQTCSDQTQALANAVDGDPVFCGFPSGLVTGLAPSCFVSGVGTVTFRICNVTVGAINPAAGNFSALRLK